ncbi:hypothetical protein AB0J35_05020 [Nonomuraea angiospora]|uniref:hypothetical protein n=1 Tax=Nonomuraea angiospora TaxID=46172 RepID=UPI003420450D
MARLAHAHAAAHAPDAAAETTGEALVLATEAGLQSVRSELVRLDVVLMSRWLDQPQAVEFHELITAAAWGVATLSATIGGQAFIRGMQRRRVWIASILRQ